MTGRGQAARERPGRLREELARRGLDGFLVPRADAHQGEYVPPGAERLAWLTGFTGSAGMAIVLAERAVLLTDGRYTIQAGEQTDPALWERRHVTEEPAGDWIADVAPRGLRLGYDPWLHTERGLKPLDEACRGIGGELVPCEDNPLDAVWSDRPPAPDGPVVVHPPEMAGQDAADKRSGAGRALAEKGEAAALLTMPESVAWLLNIRGGDLAHTPVVLCFALLHADGGVDLFVEPARVDGAVRAHLGEGVRLHPPEALDAALDALGAAGATVRVDPATAAIRLRDRLVAAGARVAPGPDPCALPKACKNPVELDGIREAHRRDGASVTRFLAWLAGAVAGGGVTEMAAAARLEACRREDGLYRGSSFDTISGAGPNGAVVHYRVTEESDRELAPGTLYLVDSGGQYPDGTTDITRTVAIGEPDADMRAAYTRVLQGHIALASARFPAGTTGSQLDVLARLPLWAAGLDYDHGTGHGVGAYLGVHEGPQRISKAPNSIALRPGMVVSNEPGYYRAGHWGIRIENLVAVCEDGAGENGRDMLVFETLTLAPLDRTLIDRDLLNDDEAAWVDDYHRRVRETLGPRLDEQTGAWLEAATATLGDGGREAGG